jgi:hypothetical protein
MRGRHIRLWAALAVLAPIVVSGVAQAATLAELVGWCGNSAERRERLCDTYLQTIIDGLATTDPIMNGGNRMCIPPEADRAEIIRQVSAYAARTKASNDMAALDGVGAALKGRFPCR